MLSIMCRDRLWIRHKHTPAIFPIYIDFRLELSVFICHMVILLYHVGYLKTWVSRMLTCFTKSHAEKFLYLLYKLRLYKIITLQFKSIWLLNSCSSDNYVMYIILEMYLLI